MLNFSFIYPPSVDPTTPPLALARIKGATDYYFGSDWDTAFFDENQKFARYVIDLALSGAIGRWVIDALNVPLSDELTIQLEKASDWLKHCTEDLLRAIGILKVESLFLDISKYVMAYESVKKAFEAFSLLYYPWKVWYATARPSIDVRKSDELRKALCSRHNPYLNFFESRVTDYDKTDVLGISVVYFSQLIPALTLARLIKKRNRGETVVMGGPCASSLGMVLRNKFGDFVDLVIPGDAEAFFEYLLRAKINTEKKEDLVRAAEAYIREPPNRWYKCPDSQLDYSWASMVGYLLPEPVLCLDITRGCYYGKCAFCAYGYWGSHYRRMKAKEVISTIKKIGHETGCNKFFFSVDAADPAFLEKLSAALASASSGITYCLDARLEKKFAEEDFVDRLSRSGCRAISFGMESAAQPTLDAMQKGTEAENFPKILNALYNAGIHVQVHLIHGFPGESTSAIKETVQFLRSFNAQITTAGVSSFALLRGSVMEKNPQKFGITKMISPGDIALDYKFECQIDAGYPDYEKFQKAIFSLFPALGRLTGSTTDYLLYATRYSPEEMKKILRAGIRSKLLKV